MLEKIARLLTRKPKLVVLVALLLLIPAFIGMIATPVNYDILSYLPEELESVAGEALLEEPFEMAATNMLIVENMQPAYTNKLAKEIEDVPGVSGVLCLGNTVGIQIPTDMLPADIKDAFYSGDATMMLITYDKAGATVETMNAIKKINSLCNENCFLAGFSAVLKDTRDLVDSEMPLYIIIAVILAYAAMSLTLESWVLPAAFLGCIGIAVVYNMGTNFFFGNISYITKAIAAVLQLGVTTDYSIFLYHRYEEEKNYCSDNRDAMSRAVQSAFLSLGGSSLTTVAGFLALCFMRLTLGRDIGLVMAKGVLIGIACVVLVLPAGLLVLDGAVKKTHHRSLMPNMNGINKFVSKHNIVFVVVFALLFVPAIYSQANAPVYYNLDRSLPRDLPSVVASEKLKDDFNMNTQHFILIHDDINGFKVKEMAERIDAVDGVESVLSYDSLLSPTIPDFFIPEEIQSIFKSDGLQLVMVNSACAVASDEAAEQVNAIKNIVSEYDANSYVTGEAALTKDLIEIAAEDFNVTSIISVAAIFVIIAIVFKSLTVPLVVVSAIELAIMLNEGIPYYTNEAVPFIAPTVISCIQLGATVDYAILMTTRFREEIRAGHDRREAVLIAANASAPSIITSALVLFCATLGVGVISKIEIISSICVMLARGSVISALVSIFILPSLLVTCEPLFAHTSLEWRRVKPKKNKKNTEIIGG